MPYLLIYMNSDIKPSHKNAIIFLNALLLVIFPQFVYNNVYGWRLVLLAVFLFVGPLLCILGVLYMSKTVALVGSGFSLACLGESIYFCVIVWKNSTYVGSSLCCSDHS